jgi:hypothetical protein
VTNDSNPAPAQHEDYRTVGTTIPLADAMRTTLMMLEHPDTRESKMNADELAEHLKMCIRTWLASLEEYLGQGDDAYALQLVFDLARVTGNPMRSIIHAADLLKVNLTQKVELVDQLGLPTDLDWREQRGIDPAIPARTVETFDCSTCGRKARTAEHGDEHVEPAPHVNGIHVPTRPGTEVSR